MWILDVWLGSEYNSYNYDIAKIILKIPEFESCSELEDDIQDPMAIAIMKNLNHLYIIGIELINKA